MTCSVPESKASTRRRRCRRNYGVFIAKQTSLEYRRITGWGWKWGAGEGGGGMKGGNLSGKQCVPRHKRWLQSTRLFLTIAPSCANTPPPRFRGVSDACAHPSTCFRVLARASRAACTFLLSFFLSFFLFFLFFFSFFFFLARARSCKARLRREKGAVTLRVTCCAFHRLPALIAQPGPGL